MKKSIFAAGILLLLLGVIAQAVIVEKVIIVQTTGSSAYVSGSTLTWSMGTSGTIYTDTWGTYNFTGANVTATFSGVTDLSSGGIAKAKFSTGDWSMSLTSAGGQSGYLEGTIVGNYMEEEVVVPAGQPTALDGRAVVRLTSAVFSGLGETVLEWGNSNMLGGIISSVLFTPDYVINDYQSGYESENLTVTLLADDQAIPEPATMLLLGLGAVLLRKKK